MRLLIRQECYANQPSEWAESQCPSLRLILWLLVFFVFQYVNSMFDEQKSTCFIVEKSRVLECFQLKRDPLFDIRAV